MGRKRFALAILGATAAVCEMLIALRVAGAKCGDSCEVSPDKTPGSQINWWQDEMPGSGAVRPGWRRPTW